MSEDWDNTWGSTNYRLYCGGGVGFGIVDDRVAGKLSADLIRLTWSDVNVPNAVHVNMDVQID